MKLRIIGDVHGFYDAYIPIAQEADYSIQVGDMGFNYKLIEELDPHKHVFIMGNHDDYDNVPPLRALDSFGLSSIGNFNFFYVSGGFSIDWKMRQAHFFRTGVRTYWDNEELSLDEMYECLRSYKEIKPDFVISHECPRSISKRVGDNKILKMFGYNPETFSTRTSELLEAMFQAHQPKRWIFGHYHKDWSEVINGTHFTCLNELSYMDLEI
jgi:predicted phosphodiesterase